ncbi:TlyA family RNA methyltransferase [Brunnivagina elsteri]|uniref:TlyA family rRNA (Cytidine-2'-O)-methyltransferase n=1 Tax=Brunnivagina elsteri CCALA 953 TaxID=987040 RepID=A0A2A2TF01_9CYAN|nr:TlyA family RNA methyltransferase [Calothrix elsteri]PAX52215.1 TlyA family rRNA (cytidine-2'-O)-methyltransferase [Calothrix elsteri CCALA 953]
MAKQRLDTLLVDKNLCTSRALAQRLIQAGEVTVNGAIVDKAGTDIDVSAEIKIKVRSRFVSRGGEKLAKALEYFSINVAGRVCLDAGISTGGFTDCLLQTGAKLVYGVDVGYGQVDWKLRTDSRVVLLERTNIRHLKSEDLYKKSPPEQEGIAEFIVVDVSFISVTKILAVLWQLSQEPREMILLIKPQFEVGKNRVGKKGVVRDSNDHADAIYQVLQVANQVGWKYRGLTWSPITGPAGNIEYLMWLAMESQVLAPELEAIKQLTKSAVDELK